MTTPRIKPSTRSAASDGTLDRACKRGEHIELFAEKLLSGPLPWARMRQAYALLRPCDKYAKEESKDVYQLFLERTGRASMIVTSNRDTAEWLPMFDDVLLAQSAVDRFKNAAFDFVIEGESYRPRLVSHQVNLPARFLCTHGTHIGRSTQENDCGLTQCNDYGQCHAWLRY